MERRNREPTRIGVLADPDGASEQVGKQLAKTFADDLANLMGGDASEWEVRVEYERLPAGVRDDSRSMLGHGADWREEHELAAVLCVSDLPMHADGRPIVADLARERRVAVLSVPAFGGMSLRRQVRRLATELVAELLGRELDRSDTTDRSTRQGTPGRFRWETPEDPEAGVDLRVLASRGRLRLLIGMVRANRPWQLATGLTGAMVAAFAISAFYLVSSVVWQLAGTLGPIRLTIAMLAALISLVAWLILRHQMWERPQDADIPYEREQIRLFNLSTLVTLTIGVLCLYAMLFTAILAAAALLIPASQLVSYAGGSGPGTYLLLTWMITSVATLGGALGSGLDSDRAVRAAAYGYRERERLNRWQQDRQKS